MTDGIDNTPLPDRGCGPCNVCCTALGVDELAKFAGDTCRFLDDKHFGNQHCCTIYDKRPPACVKFNCCWRYGLGPTISGRPDRSGLMVVLYPSHPDEDHHSISAVITVVDSRRCGTLDDSTSQLRIFLDQLLQLGITDIKVLNRQTGKVLYFKDGLVYQGRLLPQTSYEDLQFEAAEPPIGRFSLQPSDLKGTNQ